MKHLGRMTLVNMHDGLEGFSLRLFRNHLEMSEEEFQLRIELAKRDLLNTHIHAYWTV